MEPTFHPEMSREQRKSRRQEVLKDATEVYRGQG